MEEPKVTSESRAVNMEMALAVTNELKEGKGSPLALIDLCLPLF